tara:strand:+ start:7934 stop:9103 length:1170 start_codon:yes stop_codon:yes gene_type:complete
VKKFIDLVIQNKIKAFGVLILTVLAFIYFGGSGDDNSLEVSIQKVKRKDLQSKVVADGVLTPETEVKLSANNTTYITAIAVKEGDFVKKGDFLMSLDDRQQKAATEASRAGLEAAKVQLEQRKAQQERQAKLYSQGLISDQEMESTNSSYASALSAYNGAQSRLIQDEDALSKLRLIAPQDGTITFIDGEVGDLAQGGMFNPSVLLKLSDLSKMEVYVNVNENDIADISIDDIVLIEVDAYDGKKFKGEVKEVAYASSVSSGGSQQQVTNFQVKIKMLEVVEGMRPGMSATVDIITSQSPNALSIPIQSLTSSRSNKKGTNIVFVYDNNIVKERVVETGIVGDRDYEVLSGLEEGEQIVTGSFIAISRELTDGMKVKIRELQKNRKKRG